MEKGSHRDDFERTALPHLDKLYGAAMRYTRDPAMAEDLVQDTIVRAFRFWHSFKPGTSIRAWLFTILRNTFINGYHRQNKRSSFKRRVREEMTSSGASMARMGAEAEEAELMAKRAASLSMNSVRRSSGHARRSALRVTSAPASSRTPVDTAPAALLRARACRCGGYSAASAASLKATAKAIRLHAEPSGRLSQLIIILAACWMLR